MNLSALTSFDIYGTKLGIDVRRGDTLQVQGGLGRHRFGFVNIGIAGYALWQVTDYGGSALAAAAARRTGHSVRRGSRDRIWRFRPFSVNSRCATRKTSPTGRGPWATWS